MTRRPSASGRPVKARRKSAQAKLRNRPKSEALLSTSASQEAEIARLSGQLNEALERQIATSEVLQIISSSPGDLQPIFASMLEKAVDICDAKFGTIYQWDGAGVSILATHNTPPAYAEARKTSFQPPAGPPSTGC